MAEADSKAARHSIPIDPKDAARVLVELDHAAALVELVRHHYESAELMEAFFAAERVSGIKGLPRGALWPGEVEVASVRVALYTAWTEIQAARERVAGAQKKMEAL